MKRPFKTLVIVVGSFSLLAGCIRGFDSGRHEFVRFCEPIDRIQTFSANHNFSKGVWNKIVGQNCQCDLSKHYSNGFVDGYADYLNLGGNGQPLVPPTKYWKVRFRTAEGRRLTEQYLNGFRHGATLAMQAGRDLALIYASPVIDSYQVIEAMPPGTCFVANLENYPAQPAELEKSISTLDVAAGSVELSLAEPVIAQESQQPLLDNTTLASSSNTDMEVAMPAKTTALNAGSHGGIGWTGLDLRASVSQSKDIVSASLLAGRFQAVSHGSGASTIGATARESADVASIDSRTAQLTLETPITTSQDASGPKHGLALLSHLLRTSFSTSIDGYGPLNSHVAPLGEMKTTDSPSGVASTVVLHSSRRTHRNPK